MGTTSSRIYFDYAATAPLRPEARVAMLEALEAFGNPSSVHGEGQAARFLLDSSRRKVADALGVRAERMVFTSGGTEANNLALRGCGGGILYSAVEHDCVLDTAAALGGVVIPVGADGVVDLAALRDLLARGGVKVVSVMHANNETGVVQPIKEVAALVREFGALLHVDAVQTVGHIAVDVDALGADLLSFSGHKFGGPKGVGALVVKPELKMQALLTGGAQERNRRAGTENMPGIAGMAAALKAAAGGMARERAVADEIGAVVAGALPAGAEMVAAGSERVPHIMQLRTPGKRGEDVVIGMDLKGVAVSQGSACSSGRVQASHVLKAMGFDDVAAGEGVRLSWGWASTVNEARAAAAALAGVV